MEVLKTVSKRKFLSADPEKCVGCTICEYVCSMEKEGEFNPLKSRIRVVRIQPLIDLAVACRLCEDPPCVAACPRKALSADDETGIILVDEDKCNGCGWCAEACDYGAITLHPETKKVMTCDLCITRESSEPPCVEWCPEEALELMTSETLAQRARMASVRRLFKEALEEEL